MTCKNRPRYDYNVFGGMLNLAQSIYEEVASYSKVTLFKGNLNV